jgi:hypothetical protein
MIDRNLKTPSKQLVDSELEKAFLNASARGV